MSSIIQQYLSDTNAICEHSREYKMELYQKAKDAGNPIPLINDPCVLLLWQKDHPSDVQRIATIASHKLGNHVFCETKEKCDTVQKFLEDNAPGQRQLL